jgi:hypothetical protein
VALTLLLLSGNIKSNPGPASSISLLQPEDILLPVPTPADGHCLFHALSISLLHQLNIQLSTNHVVNAVRTELLHNMNDYSSFGFNSAAEYLHLVDMYTVNKCYSSAIGDVAPLAAANALAVQVVILDSVSPNIHCCATIDHRATVPSSGTVYIYLRNEHYSGINIVQTAACLTSILLTSHAKSHSSPKPDRRQQLCHPLICLPHQL